jgi:hypothetical protein
MMQAVRGVQRLIETAGYTITYRAIPAGTYSAATGKLTATPVEHEIKAHVRYAKNKDITGLVNYNDRELRLRAIDLPFTPKEGDEVVIQGKKYRVASINTMNAGENPAIHIMQVSGQ